MYWLEKIAKDLSKGLNLEVYLTIAVALAVIVLDAVSVVSLETISAVILATLALLAFSTINNRWQMETLQEQTTPLSKWVEEHLLGRTRAEDLLLRRAPRYDDELAAAEQIFIAGVTLSRTVRTYLGIFEERLKAGASIRLIIIDPQSNVVEQAALRSFGVTDARYYPNRIRPTLDIFKILASLPNLKGSLELSLLPFLPSFGLIMIDPDKTEGKIYVEIYQHKSVALNPAFVLERGSEPTWYDFFREQFDLLWDSARPVEAGDTQEPA